MPMVTKLILKWWGFKMQLRVKLGGGDKLGGFSLTRLLCRSSSMAAGTEGLKRNLQCCHLVMYTEHCSVQNFLKIVL